jgi:TetR/AcrR family hemagglutinin/protease transcriptional regulator
MKSSVYDETGRRPRAARLTPEARRAQLLACATGLFARQGIGAVSHSELAREAGVAVSTTFAYFPTREDLMTAVFEPVERLYVELAEAAHESDRPAPEVLLAHTRAFAASVDDHPDETRVWLNWSSSVGGDYWPRYRALEERVDSVLERTIARGQREGSIDPDLDQKQGARLIIGAAFLIAQMKLSGRPDVEVDAFVDTLVRVIAGGLAPRVAPGPRLV